MEADRVNSENCADVHHDQVGRRAQANLEVAKVWTRVSDAWEASGESWLQYWRGVLGQCLGDNEAAEADLQAFADGAEDDASQGAVVRDARRRLERLATRDVAASSRHGRRTAPFELRATLGFGAASRLRYCDDPQVPIGTYGGSMRVTCLGSDVAEPGDDGGGAYATADVGVAGFGHPNLGVGVGLVWRESEPIRSAWASVGPIVRVPAGPRGAITLRLEPGFVVGWHELEPLAGNPKYRSGGDMLDAGRYGFVHLGGALRIGARLSLGRPSMLGLWAQG